MKPLVIPAQAGIQKIFLLRRGLRDRFRLFLDSGSRRKAAVRNDESLGVY
jgi:hypothetical protein